MEKHFDKLKQSALKPIYRIMEEIQQQDSCINRLAHAVQILEKKNLELKKRPMQEMRHLLGKAEILAGKLKSYAKGVGPDTQQARQWLKQYRALVRKGK